MSCLELLDLDAEKKLGRLLKHRMVEKNINRYDPPKKQQATSHLWVTMHMPFGFQVVLHVPFFFCSDASLESMRHSKASSNTF